MKNLKLEIPQFFSYKDFLGELEISYRRTTKSSVHVASSCVAHKFFEPYFDKCMDMHEEMKVMFLNNANHVITIQDVSVGNLVSTTVDLKKIFLPAIILNAKGIILCHNHPSGKLVPSSSDITITKQLSEAAKLLGLKLLDSIIITREGYCSLMDEGYF